MSLNGEGRVVLPGNSTLSVLPEVLVHADAADVVFGYADVVFSTGCRNR